MSSGVEDLNITASSDCFSHFLNSSISENIVKREKLLLFIMSSNLQVGCPY